MTSHALRVALRAQQRVFLWTWCQFKGISCIRAKSCSEKTITWDLVQSSSTNSCVALESLFWKCWWANSALYDCSALMDLVKVLWTKKLPLYFPNLINPLLANLLWYFNGKTCSNNKSKRLSALTFLFKSYPPFF